MKLQTPSNEITMSSLDFLNHFINPIRLEMLETKLRNSELLRKIENECDDLGGLQIFSNPNGTDMQFYILNYDQMMLVGMRESKAVRKSVLAKLKQLSAPQQKLPQTFAEALQLAADQARQLELQAPKVEFVDRYVESTGNKTFREVAKLLQANERTFRAMLISEKIMYNLNGSWVVYSQYDKRGYFHVTTGERNGHAFNTVKFTPKGVTWISDKWNKFNK